MSILRAWQFWIVVAVVIILVLCVLSYSGVIDEIRRGREEVEGTHSSHLQPYEEDNSHHLTGCSVEDDIRYTRDGVCEATHRRILDTPSKCTSSQQIREKPLQRTSRESPSASSASLASSRYKPTSSRDFTPSVEGMREVKRSTLQQHSSVEKSHTKRSIDEKREGQDLEIEPSMPLREAVCVRPLDITPPVPAFLEETISNQKASSKGEEQARHILESIYGVSFPRCRPNELKNPHTGRNLELDGFNRELMIAFEYMGEQHYRSNHYFNKSYEDFVNLVYRDNLKVELCDKHGIYLITIPYNIPPEKMLSFITYYLPSSVAARQFSHGS